MIVIYGVYMGKIYTGVANFSLLFVLFTIVCPDRHYPSNLNTPTVTKKRRKDLWLIRPLIKVKSLNVACRFCQATNKNYRQSPWSDQTHFQILP
ncbi:hypothetical protein BDZ91DRAFT_388490 [Kalaharituber pfeilii]|nr:hypothetical protein BDZ91DRAFT_388490 [Kalaharituber pfeilii]